MLVIEVWNVIIGVTPVAFGCIVGNAQVVKTRQEHQDANDKDGDGPVCPPFADVAGKQEGADDDEKGANQKQHCGQGDSLIWNLWRTFLKLEVDVAIICAGKPRVLHFTTGDPCSHVGTRRHHNTVTQI